MYSGRPLGGPRRIRMPRKTERRGKRFGTNELTMPEATRISSRGAEAGKRRMTGEVLSLRHGKWGEEPWLSGSMSVGDEKQRVGFVARGVGGFEIGRLMEVEGYWDLHDEFGLQFHVEVVTGSVPPKERRALARYLAANLPGVGMKGAEKLVSVLGQEVLGRLRADPSVVRGIIGGRRGGTAAAGAETWIQRTESESWSTDVAPRLMAEADVTYGAARRICEFFGSAGAADIVVRRTPYDLLEIPGFGWNKVEKIGRAMGVERGAENRARGALLWSMDRARTRGHSAAPRSLLLSAASKLSGISIKELSRVLARLAEEGVLQRANGFLYRDDVLLQEMDLATTIRWFWSVGPLLSDEDAAKIESVIKKSGLTSEQADAVRMALRESVSVLTGRPGTGKTTTLREIVRAAEQIGLQVRVVAPTGKAASRASEVTGARAFTVHKMLGGNPGDERESGPISRGILIVDEASMLDLETAAWLAINIAPGPDFRLLIVGDENQLPSVGHGQVLDDLLSSGGIPHITLTRILRQAEQSTIALQAHRLLDGHSLDLDEAFDFRFVELPEDPVLAQTVVLDAVRAATQEETTSVVRAAEGNRFDPLLHLQVLTPRNTGPLGTFDLNPLLGRWLNPRPEPGALIAHGQAARLGDRVICIQNDYSVGEDGVFNGEQGVVVDVGGGAIRLRMDDGRELETRGIQNGLFTLAFAVTVHKSQGSEYPVAVVVFHSSQSPLLERRVLYTAITRAKERLVLCADRAALRVASRALGEGTYRHTGLRRILERGVA